MMSIFYNADCRHVTVNDSRNVEDWRHVTDAIDERHPIVNVNYLLVR